MLYKSLGRNLHCWPCACAIHRSRHVCVLSRHGDKGTSQRLSRVPTERLCRRRHALVPLHHPRHLVIWIRLLHWLHLRELLHWLHVLLRIAWLSDRLLLHLRKLLLLHRLLIHWLLVHRLLLQRLLLHRLLDHLGVGIIDLLLLVRHCRLLRQRLRVLGFEGVCLWFLLRDLLKLGIFFPLLGFLLRRTFLCFGSLRLPFLHFLAAAANDEDDHHNHNHQCHHDPCYHSSTGRGRGRRVSNG